jgi:predicted N-formylglutamate amidohydrolase
MGRPLGIDNPADLARHIAVDVGVDGTTSYLADAAAAHVFRATHSRLVADLNRFEDENECIAVNADGTEIPVNRALTEEQRKARLDRFYFPFLKSLNDFIAEIAEEAGAEPFVISMHSFARTQKEDPTPKCEDICVFGYPEFGPSPKLEEFVSQLRKENPQLQVGDNRPFSACTPGLTVSNDDPRRRCPVTYYNVVKRNNVFNHFVVEICQDLLQSDDDQRRMAQRLLSALNATIPL